MATIDTGDTKVPTDPQVVPAETPEAPKRRLRHNEWPDDSAQAEQLRLMEVMASHWSVGLIM